MKIISWNINSLRLRLPLLKNLIDEQNPDVICLQETKVNDEQFPLTEIQNFGFKFIEFSGEKSYNGVAILSKLPIEKVKKYDILNFGHKRHIAVALPDQTILHNFYVPAGGDVPDPTLNNKFDFKLKFIDWMSDYFSKNYSKKDPIIMLGDINIAPLENDVWSHKQLLSVVSHTPIELEKLNHLKNTLDWVDSHRLFVPEDQKLYSWWSYRAIDPIISNRGRRLDHIWTTPILKNKIKSADILKSFRTMNQPSDHVPITLNINL